MKNSVLILALMLAACASDIRWGNTPGTVDAAKESRKIDAKPPPLPAKSQTPERKEPELPPPKKREHNIEED